MGCGSSKPAAASVTAPSNKTGPSAPSNILVADLLKKYKNKNVWDDYKKLKELGAGGFGSVVIGQRKDKAEFAIKTQIVPMSSENTKNGQDSLRVFDQECEILGSLHHPNICFLIDCYVYKPRVVKNENEVVHLVMVLELCKGEELFDYVFNYGAFCEKDALLMFRTIIGAIAHLHSNDIVHMDLKPENFVFSHPLGDKNRALKLIDFGIAAKMKPTDKINLQFMSLVYSSPEVLKNYKRPLTGEDMRANDMWAVGVVLYIFITGTRPFEGETEEELQADFKKGICFHSGVKLSPMVTDLLGKLLEMNPKKRITAEQAKMHPWLSSAAASAPLFSPGMFKSLKHIGKASKFKKAMAQFLAIKGKELGSNVQTVGEFQEADKDMNGTLDHNEAALFLQKARIGGGKMASEAQINVAAQALMKNVDVDGNGSIDVNEFASALNVAELTCNLDLVTKLFNLLDTDHDNFVSAKELQNAFKGLQMDAIINDSEWEQQVREHSSTKTGDRLSRTEFNQIMMDITGGNNELKKDVSLAEYTIKEKKKQSA